ncbi:MAG TPA: VOC family protein [Chitinophagaceae bacterium]|nr:VOC family protein [Chitinophagaceae bacterium]
MKYFFSLACLLVLFSDFSFAQPGNKPKAMLNHIAIYVVDLQKSGDFYQNIIGLDTIPEPFHDGRHIWMRIGPLSHLHIISGAAAPKEYFKSNHICFSVASVDLFIEKLKAKSLSWEDWQGTKNAITTRVDGVKQIWLQDPDGYWIEINDAKD